MRPVLPYSISPVHRLHYCWLYNTLAANVQFFLSTLHVYVLRSYGINCYEFVAITEVYKLRTFWSDCQSQCMLLLFTSQELLMHIDTLMVYNQSVSSQRKHKMETFTMSE